MKPLILTGILTTDHHKGHVPLSFDIPEGTRSIDLNFYAAPDRAAGALFDNLICLSVEGPKGFRGARHNNPSRVIHIDEHSASPGFTGGPIEAGRWTLWLDIFRLLGPDEVAYRLEVTLGNTPIAEPAMPVPASTADRGRGWYRGDLHAHSLHSDATWPVSDLADFGRRRQLDFMTLSDHNTISGIAELEALGGDDLLAMGGVELTTHYGHALVLGTRDWQEWRAGSRADVDMATLASAALLDNKLFVIAHPMSPGDPSCTGCRWEYEDMRPGPAFAIEVWNGPWSDYNEEGLEIACEWINEAWEDGRRLVLTAGTDIHGAHEDDLIFGFNHVFAEHLTEAAILDGIAAGHNILSSGPRLKFSARSPDGQIAIVGDQILSRELELLVEWQDMPEAGQLQIIGNGKPVGTIPVAGDGAWRWREDIATTRWFMIQARNADGIMLALTNPVFARPAA